MGSCGLLGIDEDEYAKLIRKMNLPRVVIDNDTCDSATVIRVDSSNKHGYLLEVVQLLTDLNLIITKAYVSSDGSWFMNVFNVTDCDGNKVQCEEIISNIQTSIETDTLFLPKLWNSIDLMPSNEYTSIELTGNDRPGLLSEVCAVLTDLNCNVVKAEVWTHNTRAAAVVHITDGTIGRAVEDQRKLSCIKELLANVLRGDGDSSAAKTTISMGLTHTERRLHQMMLHDEQEFECAYVEGGQDESSRPQVALMDCSEKDYTIVMLRSKDRPKLLFDTVCTLTDMEYVVFHGTVSTGSGEAYQEYYIRHVDGHAISTEAERQHMIRCLEAAIERRASEGLELELRTEDRVGLLSDITRVFRENGLSIKRAEITTEDGNAVDTFYLSEMSGDPVDSKTIESIQRQIGKTILNVKRRNKESSKAPEETSTARFLFGNLLKVCSFQSFRLIGSYS